MLEQSGLVYVPMPPFGAEIFIINHAFKSYIGEMVFGTICKQRFLVTDNKTAILIAHLLLQ